MSEAGEQLSANAAQLRALVKTYCSVERNPALKAFEVIGPLAISDALRGDSGDGPGCYVIYDVEGGFRYVGMSTSRISDRLASHFSAPVQRSTFWANGKAPHCVDIMRVSRPWEALSLEGYLIEQIATFAP